MERKTKQTAHTKREFIRVGKYLRELVTIHDEKGNVLHRILNPLMLEVRGRDIVQIIVGSMILAIPVGLTEEVWRLGATLSPINVVFILIISVGSISLFVYYNYYRRHFSTHKEEFVKRVIAIYVFSFIVVGVFLSLIEVASWSADFALALRQTIIVALPASMSAAVVDMIK